jgi:hypothetical protein
MTDYLFFPRLQNKYSYFLAAVCIFCEKWRFSTTPPQSLSITCCTIQQSYSIQWVSIREKAFQQGPRRRCIMCDDDIEVARFRVRKSGHVSYLLSVPVPPITKIKYQKSLIYPDGE